MNEPRGRGRPRKFEQGAALDAALQTFWTKGYRGASMDDLTSSMSMNKPSLYAAFGDKEELYLAAIDHYVATIGRDFLAPLSSGKSLHESLSGFFARVIDTVTGAHGPLGCAIACTLPAETMESAEIQGKLAALVDEIDDAVHARLRAAQKVGELSPDADPLALAQLVVGTMFSCAIRARAGADRRTLKRITRALITMIVPRPYSRTESQ